MDSHSPVVGSMAEVPTAKAGQYLEQLCKHFGHKLPVTFDEGAGHIPFDFGECLLDARNGVLRLSLAAPDDERLTKLQGVVASHLLRFAFREGIHVDWRPA